MAYNNMGGSVTDSVYPFPRANAFIVPKWLFNRVIERHYHPKNQFREK